MLARTAVIPSGLVIEQYVEPEGSRSQNSVRNSPVKQSVYCTVPAVVT